jgi:hypothetical protein
MIRIRRKELECVWDFMTGKNKGIVPDAIRKRIGRWKKIGILKEEEGMFFLGEKKIVPVDHTKQRMEAIRDCHVSVGHGGVHKTYKKEVGRLITPSQRL